MPAPLPDLLFERRLSAAGRGAGVAPGSRVPVRRCGLRGRSGLRVAAVPAARASRSPPSQPCGNPHAAPAVARRLGARCAANSWPATARGDSICICRSPAARSSAAITRGRRGLKPTMFGYATPLEPLTPALLEQGVSAMTARGHALGAPRHQVHGAARQYAAQETRCRCRRLRDHHAGERRTHRRVFDHRARREGGVIRTPPNGHHILPGTTRDVVGRAGRIGWRSSTAAAASRKPSCVPRTRSGWHSPRAACCR